MLFWASLVLLMTGLMSMGRTLDKRAISGAELPVAVQKRPFCNAFTGCGRKRSDDSYIPLPIGQGAAFEQNDMTGGDSKFWGLFSAKTVRVTCLACDGAQRDEAQTVSVGFSNRKKKKVCF